MSYNHCFVGELPSVLSRDQKIAIRSAVTIDSEAEREKPKLYFGALQEDYDSHFNGQQVQEVPNLNQDALNDVTYNIRRCL